LHVLIPAAKLLSFLGSVAMQNIAVRGIRNGWWEVRCYAPYCLSD